MLSFIESAIAQLKEKDSIREQIIKNSRELVRISRSIVVNTHNSNDVKDLIQQSKEIVNNIISMLKIYPDLIDSARNALQEYAEAFIFNLILTENRIPSFMELNIDPASYLLGISDALGELKREIIKKIDQWNVDEAVKLLELMRSINSELSKWDLPDAIAPGLRHKVDVNRHLIEDLEMILSEAKRTHELLLYISKLLSSLEKI
jgi:translin